jgi:asparagine synthase (glutamine-hydrolysing)
MTREGYVLVFNGEIYNYRTLREQLRSSGCSFRTDSDTEVFLQGYREWGLDLFDRVRGMFSAVVWDERKERTILVRDHVGQKPLFYYQSEEQFLAGSELQGLLAASDRIERRADPASLSWYLSLGYVPSPRSAFFDLKKLPPGHYMIVDGTEIQEQVRYWDPVKVSRQPEIEGTVVETVRETVRTAVERRLVSDVPLGAFLSGGLDSSVIVGLMSDELDTNFKTVSVGFEDDTYDERNHAKTVADRHGTDHQSFSVRPSLEDVLPDLVQHFGEPFADSSAVPTYYLAKKTRHLVKVTLSGDGGDEVFGGYRRYRALQYWSYLKSIVPGRLLRGVQRLGESLPDTSDRRSGYGELLRLLRMSSQSSVEQYQEMVGLGYDDWKENLARGPLKKPARRGGEQWLERWFRRFDHVENPAQQAMFVDLMSYLPGDLLVKTDITTMMNSLECRSPFLDRDVLELGLRLPTERKIRGSNQKTILKRAFRDYLPESVRNRSKMGFGVPLAAWFREDPEAEYLREVLMDAGPALWDLLNRQKVAKYLEAHRANKTDAGPLLWALTVLSLWFEEYDVRI